MPLGKIPLKNVQKFALKLRDFANAREPWNLVLEHWFSLVGERQGALIVGT